MFTNKATLTVDDAPDYVREICARWQSSGYIGSAFAALASGHSVPLSDFKRDIELTRDYETVTDDDRIEMAILEAYAREEEILE